MGIFDFFSGACSVVSSICSSFANFVRGFAPTIAGKLDLVSGVFSNIAALLGVFNPGERIDEMGDRALQAREDGIQPENFQKYDEYMAALRNFQLDPEKSKNYDHETKNLAGIALACHGIEQKFDLREGTAGSLAAMSVINPDYFTEGRILNWFNSGGGSSVEQFVAWFDGKVGAADGAQIMGKIIEVEKGSSNKTEAEVRMDALNAQQSLHQQG